MELAELVVDGDAQRLERPRRRVLVGVARRAGRGHRARQAQRVGELAGFGGALERPSDAARVALLAVLPQDAGQRLVVEAADELERGLAVLGIHAHVDRALPLPREAAARLVDLHRRHAEVRDDAVELRDADRPDLPELPELIEQGRQLAEAAAHRDEAVAEARQALAGDAQGLGIAIDADHPARRAAGLQDALGVAASAEGGVAVGAAGLRRQEAHHFFWEYRAVRCAGVARGHGRPSI